jgi:hypothetical protein
LQLNSASSRRDDAQREDEVEEAAGFLFLVTAGGGGGIGDGRLMRPDRSARRPGRRTAANSQLVMGCMRVCSPARGAIQEVSRVYVVLLWIRDGREGNEIDL